MAIQEYRVQDSDKIGVCLNKHRDKTLRTEFWPTLAL